MRVVSVVIGHLVRVVSVLIGHLAPVVPEVRVLVIYGPFRRALRFLQFLIVQVDAVGENFSGGQHDVDGGVSGPPPLNPVVQPWAGPSIYAPI